MFAISLSIVYRSINKIITKKRASGVTFHLPSPSAAVDGGWIHQQSLQTSIPSALKAIGSWVICASLIPGNHSAKAIGGKRYTCVRRGANACPILMAHAWYLNLRRSHLRIYALPSACIIRRQNKQEMFEGELYSKSDDHYLSWCSPAHLRSGRILVITFVQTSFHTQAAAAWPQAIVRNFLVFSCLSRQKQPKEF